jgi:sodium transport system permease protein
VKSIWLVLKKELIEQFRDRKTLFTALFLPVLIWAAMAFLTDSFASQNNEKEVRIPVTSKWTEAQQEQFTQLTGLKTYVPKDPAKEVETGEAELYLDIDQKAKKVKLFISDKGVDPSFITQIENYVLKVNQSNLPPDTAKNNFQLETQETAGEENMMLKIFTGYLMLSIIIGMTPVISGAGIAVDAIAGEKERGTIRSLLSLPISPSKIWCGKWLAVTFYSLISFGITLGVYAGIQPYLENQTLKLDWFLALPISFQVGIVFLLLIYIATTSAILLFLSTFAKSFKEAQGYLWPVNLLPMVVSFYLAFGASEDTLSSSYFFVPFANIQAVLFEGAGQTLTLTHLLFAILSSILFIAIVIYISSNVFRKPNRMITN